jgi:hypothetical protein
VALACSRHVLHATQSTRRSADCRDRTWPSFNLGSQPCSGSIFVKPVNSMQHRSRSNLELVFLGQRALTPLGGRYGNDDTIQSLHHQKSNQWDATWQSINKLEYAIVRLMSFCWPRQSKLLIMQLDVPHAPRVEPAQKRFDQLVLRTLGR